MKKYKVAFEESYEVVIEAENEDKARELFMDGEYDGQVFMGITSCDVYEN